jgi:GT2 family glycosyltransferase/SAM-dependent methyltransferase
MRTGYHDLLRREILELVPPTAKSLLDLGCGTGKLGKAIKERQSCFVEGIELNKEAAKIAENNLDVVITDNLNRYDPTFSKNRYDCIVFADILEHLISPWTVLNKFASVLTDDGVIIASIPNVAHPWIIENLQKGLFRYEPSGILDITHLRFFTKTTIFQMFARCGLKITKFRPWPDAKNPVQYHITAIKPRLQFKNPTTTILVLTYNGWEWTEGCLDSIKKNTKEPHKILVIDNGSTDGTVERLRADTTLLHIENSHNLGFGRGFNLGLMLVDTPYFVLSNSDVIVTKDWLKRMIQHIDTDKKLLILGPRSNYVSGPQLISNVPYTDNAGLEKYAHELALGALNRVMYFPRIVFFFVLLKSVALQKVGFFDEIFGLGNFEDDDYCLRAIRAGYKLGFINTVFIHHYGSQTFKHNKIDYENLMRENQKRFMSKWHLTQYGRR